MEISLISPSNYMYSSKGIFPQVLRYAPLTLTTLASLVPQDMGATIKIIDEGINDCPTDLKSDIICISAITGTAKRSYAIGDFYRRQGAKVILGGVHPTILPEEAKKHADAVIVGQGYGAFPRTIRDSIEGRLEGFYYNEGFDINSIPPPRRDLVKKSSYITKNSIQITYGCENCCDFCVIPPTQGSHKTRCMESVIKDLSTMQGRFISVVDPNLTNNREYSLELFRKMKPLNVQWGGLGTVEVGEDPELLDAMAESGCKGILLGFESVSQKTNNGFHKGVNNVDRYFDVVRNVHDRGIAINGTFMFGSDEDNTDCFNKTFEFVNEAGIDLPRFSVYTPFPGTKAFKLLQKENRITENDWALYDAQHVVFQPKNMSPKELKEGLSSTWEKTYSLKSIRKRLSVSKCSPLISFITNLGYRYYGRRLRNFDNETVLKLEAERNGQFTNE